MHNLKLCKSLHGNIKVHLSIQKPDKQVTRSAVNHIVYLYSNNMAQAGC